MSSSMKPSIEEESFIILGTSPGTSLDMKCNGVDGSLDHLQLDDALKEVGPEASMAFKAHFKLGDCPSPGSLMVASTIITDDKTTEQLQKSFGEILDENVILKETLKQNNESMKEQFLLIASCQEDMLRTHKMHQEKFNETRELVEKLREENKQLRLDMARLAEAEKAEQLSPQLTQSQVSQKSQQSLTSSQLSSGSKSGPSSAMEFVTSPDDDTINKLTAQLALVEKQRREVIVENDKLIWQKESLEHIVDATSKERDDLKDKLLSLQLQLASIESEHAQRMDLLNLTIQELNVRLKEACNKPSSTEEISNRDAIIQQLDTKVKALQNDLKNAQLKILDLENVKLEFSKYKSGVSETVKMYKDQIQELNNRLKEAQTTVFQPVNCSISSEAKSSSELSSLMKNVKIYDRTLKHLAELLNLITHGSSDSLAQAVGTCASLHEYTLDRASANNVRAGLSELKGLLVKQHADSLANVVQVRGTLSIFEGIFKDCNELIKKSITKPENTPASGNNVETLTAALLARGQELLALKSELTALKADREDKQLLKAQLELYKGDFEAERDAREKMASEKEILNTDLRKAQRKNEELLMQLEEVRKLNPNIHKSATSKRTGHGPAPSAGAAGAGGATGNMVYTCPKCMRFSSDQYKVMEDHFDFCLDDF